VLIGGKHGDREGQPGPYAGAIKLGPLLCPGKNMRALWPPRRPASVLKGSYNVERSDALQVDRPHAVARAVSSAGPHARTRTSSLARERAGKEQTLVRPATGTWARTLQALALVVELLGPAAAAAAPLAHHGGGRTRPARCSHFCALRGGCADTAREFRNEAQDLLAAGEPAAALAAYERAVDAVPTDAESLVALGRLLDQVRGNQQAAFDLFVRAVNAAPNSPVALSNYAFGLDNWCDRTVLAEDVYWRAEALDPTSVPILINLASLLEQPLQRRDPRYEDGMTQESHRQRTAHRLYERALALEPGNINALCNYAGMLMTYGENPASEDAASCVPDAALQRGGERASELLAQALALAPNNPAVLINYGVLMEDWGDNKQLAWRLYQRAVEAEPANSAAVCSLTRLLRLLQRLTEAEEVAQLCHKENPET
jgi:Flp pilus assembly protein TadD